MITLPCPKCGHPVVLPVEEVRYLPCPECQFEREIRWFSSPRAWEKWRVYALFERARQVQQAALGAAR